MGEQIWQQTDIHAKHLNHLRGSALVLRGAWTCRDAGNYESRGGVGLSSIVLDIRTFRIKAFTFKPRVIHILLDY